MDSVYGIFGYSKSETKTKKITQLTDNGVGDSSESRFNKQCKSELDQLCVINRRVVGFKTGNNSLIKNSFLVSTVPLIQHVC